MSVNNTVKQYGIVNSINNFGKQSPTIDINIPLRILDLRMFAEKNTSIILDGGEIYNFKAQYSLETKKVDKYVTVTLKSLLKTQELIQSVYDSCKKYNVCLSLKHINNWVKIAKLYYASLEQKEAKATITDAVNFKMTLYSLITRETKVVDFQSTYFEYKLTYGVPDGELVDLNHFKKYLNLNYLKIDEDSFRNALYTLGVEGST